MLSGVGTLMGLFLTSCLIGFESVVNRLMKIADITRIAKTLGSHWIKIIIWRPTVSVPFGIIMSRTGSSRILRGMELKPETSDFSISLDL